MSKLLPTCLLPIFRSSQLKMSLLFEFRLCWILRWAFVPLYKEVNVIPPQVRVGSSIEL